MNPESISESNAGQTRGVGEHANGAAATALQQAIRMRSIDTLNADQARPPVPLSQRLLILGLTLAAMLVFILMINFIVTGVQKIMDVWYPGTISNKGMEITSPAPAVFDPKQPIYISVDPPADSALSNEHSSAANSNAVGH
jgi:hypothetical protein